MGLVALKAAVVWLIVSDTPDDEDYSRSDSTGANETEQVFPPLLSTEFSAIG